MITEEKAVIRFFTFSIFCSPQIIGKHERPEDLRPCKKKKKEEQYDR